MKKFFILMFCIIAQYSFVSAQAIMKIWENGNVSKTVLTTAVDSITFKSLNNDVIMIDGHEFVDLGLPSGLLWATCNIGAATPADDGNYYAWGETSTKSTYSNTNYFDSKYTIYTTSTRDNLLKKHDAAYVNWGTSCRMPTNDNFAELLDSKNCTWTWTSKTTSDGSSINGYTVTSTKNYNSIFIPASGYRYDEILNDHGSVCRYWSRTLNSNAYKYGSVCFCPDAYCLYFDGSDHRQSNSYRFEGFTIRPVAEYE